MLAVLMQTHLMLWSDHDKTLSNFPFPVNSVIIDQLALTLVDIYLDYMLEINHCYALEKMRRLTAQESPKLCNFIFEIVCLTQFSTDFTNLDLRI